MISPTNAVSAAPIPLIPTNFLKGLCCLLFIFLSSHPSSVTLDSFIFKCCCHCQDLILTGLFCHNLSSDPSIAHNDDPVCDPHNLRHFRGYKHNCNSLLLQVIHQIVDLNLCSYINSTSGLLPAISQLLLSAGFLPKDCRNQFPHLVF